MDVSELFRQHEATISARAREAGIVQHAGDRGANRREILRDLLLQHLAINATSGTFRWIINGAGQITHRFLTGD